MLSNYAASLAREPESGILLVEDCCSLLYDIFCFHAYNIYMYGNWVECAYRSIKLLMLMGGELYLIS